MARDHKGGGEAVVRSDGKSRMDMLDWKAENWETPSVAVTDGTRMTRGGSRSNELLLTGQAVQVADHWRTPQAGDAQRGSKTQRGYSSKYKDQAGQHSLVTQTAHWPTPMAGAAGTHTYNAAGNSDFSRKAEELAKGVRAFALIDLSLPDRPTPSGERSSETRRRLNPLFVEWLMGWPEGLSGFDTAGMASCHSPQPSPGCGCMDCWLTKQREMLSDLLTITPPAQGSLL